MRDCREINRRTGEKEKNVVRREGTGGGPAQPGWEEDDRECNATHTDLTIAPPRPGWISSPPGGHRGTVRSKSVGVALGNR